MRLARCLVIAALAAGLITPAAEAAPRAQEGQHTRSITLISGDKVFVDEKGDLAGTDGRRGIGFVSYVQDGHQYVVPEDAVGLLANDRVDKRFFDITALLDFGYEDAKIDRIPVRGNGVGNNFRAQIKSEAEENWGALKSREGKIWLDGKATLALNESVPLVHAPEAWQNGLDGKGVTVAVLDTGYDQEHPELKDVVTASKDFTGLGIQDTDGHGTHVASTVAGRGGRYTGVAKGANLAVGRVCGEFDCLESAIIAGMEWAAREVRAKVVNMSLGSYLASDGTDSLSQAVNRLTAETGTLFVVAAGNGNNPGKPQKVSAPAAADAALAVANTTKRNEVNESSSRGPRIGDFAVKPDVAAPGTDIVAARAKGTLPGQAVDEFHAMLTGTSMATPHVAGAAAILAQRNPSWTAQELKAQLMASAQPLPNTSPNEVGTGLVDVAKSTTQQVRADQGSLSWGLLEWPHTEVKNKTITYRNDGDQPVTLRLSVPSEHFGVPATVVVPAHGTAPVTVGLDPRKGLGQFYGHLTAEADGVRITTSVGAYVQEERHQLAVKITGRDGKPAANEFLLLVNQKTGESNALVLDANGAAGVKLPVADYAVLGRVKEYDAARHWYAPASATDIAGRVSLAKDVDVTLDARQAKPIKVDVGDSRVEVLHKEIRLEVPMAASKNSSITGPLFGATESYGMSFGDALPELRYETLVKAAQPRAKIDGQYRFPVALYGSSAPLTGRHQVRAVLPGGDVKGALVVVQHQDGEGDLYEEARKAKEGGAVAVLQVGPVPFSFEEQTAVPLIWTTQKLAAGFVRDLTDGKPVSLALTGTETAPVSYNLFYPEKGAVPAGKTYPRGPVAEVRSSYHTSGADGLVSQRLYPVLDGAPARTSSLLDEWLLAPATRTEFYSAGNGIGFYREVGIGRMFGGDARDPLSGNWSDFQALRFKPGQKTELHWNDGVSAPRMGTPPGEYASWGRNLAVRDGDWINSTISVFSAGGTAGESWRRVGWGTQELFRDGQSLGTSSPPYQGRWNVPAEPGRYELVLNAERDGASPQLQLSTKVTAKWGFTSATATGPLPLLQVDYKLPLDIRNSARAGAPIPVKFTFPRQPGAGKATVRTWKAWASYDDGATWRPVTSVIPPGGKPGGFVSLRVTATDTDGNSLDQTVLRAYHLQA